MQSSYLIFQIEIGSDLLVAGLRSSFVPQLGDIHGDPSRFSACSATSLQARAISSIIF